MNEWYTASFYWIAFVQTTSELSSLNAIANFKLWLQIDIFSTSILTAVYEIETENRKNNV